MARIPFRIDLVKPNTNFVVTEESADTIAEYPARVLCIDLVGQHYCVVVAILYTALKQFNGLTHEKLYTFDNSGYTDRDKKIILWVDEPETWILRKKDGSVTNFYSSIEYSSKESAQRIADKNPSGGWEPVRVVTE